MAFVCAWMASTGERAFRAERQMSSVASVCARTRSNSLPLTSANPPGKAAPVMAWRRASLDRLASAWTVAAATSAAFAAGAAGALASGLDGASGFGAASGLNATSLGCAGGLTAWAGAGGSDVRGLSAGFAAGVEDGLEAASATGFALPAAAGFGAGSTDAAVAAADAGALAVVFDAAGVRFPALLWSDARGAGWGAAEALRPSSAWAGALAFADARADFGFASSLTDARAPVFSVCFISLSRSESSGQG